MFQLVLLLLGAAVIFLLIRFLIFKARREGRFSPFNEKTLRSPGYTLGKELDDLNSGFTAPLLLVVIMPTWMYRPFIDADVVPVKIGILIVVAISMFFAIKQITGIWKKARKLRLGLNGEIFCGQELNYLMREGAWVYHDIPYQYGNIDHIVVSTGGIFVIETKAVRKPQNQKGKIEFKVTLNQQGALVFPHFSSSSPIRQTKHHATFLRKKLLELTGNKYPVIPVVAIPGWFVSNESDSTDVLVINPQRGKALINRVNNTLIDEKSLGIAVHHIEDMARNVLFNSDITDPDADKKFTFLLNRKSE